MDHSEPATQQPDEASPASPPPLTEAQRRSHHSALLIVFLVVFIDLLGFGIVLPLLPLYAKAFVQDLFEGGSESRWTGLVVGVMYSSFSIMQFVFAPIWGRLSDRIGRRPILLLGLGGSFVFYALFGYASELRSPDLRIVGMALLLLSRIGAGVAGATISTAQAVIADSTTPDRRSRGMALIGAAFGIGFTFGPLLGAGALALWPSSLGAPAFVASGLSLLAFVLGMWLMPETLQAGSEARHRRWLDWHSLREALQTPAIGALITTFFLATFAFANFESTVALLIKDALEYPAEKIYLLFAYIGFMLMLAQGGFYQRLARRGMKEFTFITLGTFLMIFGLAGLGVCAVVAAGWPAGESRGALLAGVLVALAVSVFGFAFLTPSAQSLISRRSDPAKQGEILGVNQSASALARILGPLVGLFVYYQEATHVLPYVVATLLLLLVLALLPRLK